MAAPTRQFTVDDVVPALRDYLDDHPTGGALHVVTDDGNLHDEHVEWCLRHALGGGWWSDGPDPRAVALCLSLLHLTRSQRARAIRAALYP